MPSLIRRRDPWFELEGSGARWHRRRRTALGFLAFLVSLGAVAGVAMEWALVLGVVGIPWLPVPFVIR